MFDDSIANEMPMRISIEYAPLCHLQNYKHAILACFNSKQIVFE